MFTFRKLSFLLTLPTATTTPSVQRMPIAVLIEKTNLASHNETKKEGVNLTHCFPQPYEHTQPERCDHQERKYRKNNRTGRENERIN